MKIRILSLLAILIALTSAQDEMVDTEILCLALDEPLSGLFYQTDREIVPFQANLNGFSEPRAYKGPRRFMLRSAEADFQNEPLPPPPVGSVDLPLGSDRVLLLCVKSKGQPLKLVAYDIAKGKSGAGDYRFFNFSNTAVSAIFGEKKFAILPGADTVASESAWKNEILEIDVQLAIVKDGKPKQVYSSVWGHRPGRRNYIFFFPGGQAYRPLHISRFFDVPSVEKAGSN